MKSWDERSATFSDGDPARARISGGGEMGKEWVFKITFHMSLTEFWFCARAVGK